MIATALLEAALRSLIMGAAVLAGLRMLGVRHVLARKIAWMLVLFASLAMPFLMRWQAFRVKPLLSVPEHWLSTQPEKPALAVGSAKSEAATPESDTAAALPVSTVPVTVPTVSLDTPMTAQAATPAWHMKWNWAEIQRWIVPVYLTVAALLLLRLLIGFVLALCIWYRAERASPMLEPRALVRISTAVNAPVTIGSGIVLPESYTEWDRAKLRAVLAHERSHVRQGDFYLQLLAGIYTTVFWFSPLGWWMQRELSEAAEAVSDRAALEEVGNRSSYAEVLLEFAAMPRRAVAGVAMARSSNIQRRIDRLLTEKLFRLAFVGFRRHAALAALLVPVALAAATSVVRVDGVGRVVLPNGVRDQEQPAPTETPVPETPKASAVAAPKAAPAVTAPAPGGTTAVPEVTKAVPVTKLTAVPGVTPQMGTVITAVEVPKIKLDLGELHRVIPMVVKQEEIRVMEPATLARLKIALPSGLQVVDSATVGDSYAILSDDDPTVYGSIADWKAFTKDKARLQGNCIWFERDGKQYVIDDPALAAQARELFKPMEELGQQQAELGKQQAELGKEQAKLGAMQSQASVKLPDMTAEIKSLEEELKTLQAQSGKEFSREDMAALEKKLSEMQGKFGEMQGKMAARQAEYGAQQSALGEQQSELGKQQAELGRQQSKLSKEANSKMKTMIDGAIKDGKAKPVD